MEPLFITDVGPRDGLQSQSTPVDVEDKLRLIHALFDAGLRSVEATSFVSPKAVPQMADADQLLPRIAQPAAASVSALVPNIRGLERAMVAGASHVAVVLSATDTMNRKNIGMDLQRATQTCEETLQRASAMGLQTRAYVAVAFECPFEGPTPSRTVAELALRMADCGAGEIVIADTIGAAGPQQVKVLLDTLLIRFSVSSLGMHFHDTRGMALCNSWAAMELGLRRFDASIGGLGGCPFAPGAAGNLATEDLVLLAGQSGYETGVDLAKLLRVVDLAQELVGYQIGGRSARWLRAASISTNER